ncbi:MAG: hypothetical protein H7Y18_03655 [Clostridiaceae bacterium]|nr:hypothetical protein [Clostridiaceae bacterium]
MGKEQLEEFNNLVKLEKELTKGWIKYWNEYSAYDDWHFWILVVLSILPLIVLFLFMDRRRMFHLGFFGFNVHICHSYIDIAAVNLGKWTYPYKLIPIYPISFAFDASLIPVTFMLLYQWTLNHKKNFYLYATMPAFFFAFIAKPLLVAINITKPGPGGGGLKAYLILFVSHLIIAYESKWITDLFRKFLVKDDFISSNQNLESVPSMPWNWVRVRKRL